MTRVAFALAGLILAADPPPPPPRTIDLGKHGFTRFTRLALSPDGSVLAVSGSEDVGKHLLSLWTTATGRHVGTIRDTNWIEGFDFSPDEKAIAVPSEKDGAVVMYDTAAGKELRRFPHRAVTFSRFAPSGRHLVTVSWEEADDADDICVWDVASGERLHAANWNGYEWNDHPRFTPDGRLLFWSANHDLRCWDPATGKERPAVAFGHYRDTRYKLSPATTRVLGQNLDSGRLRLFDPATGAVLLDRTRRFAFALGFSPDDKRLVLERSREEIEVWDATTGRRLSRFDAPAVNSPEDGPRDAVTAELLPDGRHVFVRLEIWIFNGSIRQHSAQLHTLDGKLVRRVPEVRELAFDRAGRTVAALSARRGDATRPASLTVTIDNAAAWLAGGAKKE